MLQGIERYLKQAIVDKNASVSSASLVSALVSWFMVLCVSLETCDVKFLQNILRNLVSVF